MRWNDTRKKPVPSNLAVAISTGHMPSVVALLDHHAALGQGVDEVRMFAELSLLHFAVMQKQTQVVGELLRRGADPNRLTPHGRTPLDIAEDISSPAPVAVIELLKTYGGCRSGEMADTEKPQEETAPAQVQEKMPEAEVLSRFRARAAQDRNRWKLKP